MKIDRVRQNLVDYNIEQHRLQKKRNEDYTKLIERRNYERIVAERVARNIRLDSDKGRNIDINC